ncbi:MAG: DUF192 domain-containing protein [bacterium]|nr:DUF192 domain-containing protein [bacterium]
MKPSLLTILLGLFLILTVLVSLYLTFQTSKPTTTKGETHLLKIGSQQISVEIADSHEKIVRGLSGQAELKADTGMYFVFKERSRQTFWMKDMLFSIDIIWIDQGKVIGVEKSAPVPTGTSIPIFSSPDKVTEVLEIPAGFFDQKNLQLQDPVKLIN